MDYFRKFVGTPQGDAAPSGAETIEKICERVQSSTLLEDRRGSVRALKSLSKKFRLEVGNQAMSILLGVLQQDRADAEILGYALDTLCNVMSNEPSEEDEEQAEDVPPDLCGQFTEIFLKNPDNIQLLLSLLEEYDFHVRWPTVKLVTNILTNRSKYAQECILASPMGVSKLMDLLSDSREIIRNDALLLIIQLTRGNANIQKIVAFENAYERLLDIVAEEGNSDGGIVVEDCLLLLLNLLKNNSSNQTLFREGSYIKKLTPYFQLESAGDNPQGGWSAQKVTNIHLMLQLVRSLVSPSNPQQQTTSCQKAMNQCGLLQQLCSILMASGVPADVLTETINTVSEVIRGNPANQEYFASVMAPSNPPRPAIVVLLMSMVNEKQPFVLRCAVLYCFQSFLYKNEIGQSQIVQTLLPSTADVNTITAGQLLCGGLFSTDSLSTWFAATALLHSIVGNSTQKEQLLRVQLATSLGNPPVSLLQQCANILSQSPKLQTRVGLLMLVCVWLSSCAEGVTGFLSNDANVSYLISQVSASEGDESELLIHGLCAFVLGIAVYYSSDDESNYNKEKLVQIIDKRIGIETFCDKLSQVSKHESYAKAAKKPHLNYKQPSEVLFDYEFCRLFKTLENDIVKSITPESAEERTKKAQNVEQHGSIVNQYKELIREQDMELGKIRDQLKDLEEKYSTSSKETDELRQQVQLLKDQNALLKAAKGSHNSLPVLDGANGGEELSKLQQELETQKQILTENDETIQKLRNDLTVAEAKAAISQDGFTDGQNEQAVILQSTVDRLNIEIESLRSLISEKDEELKQSNMKHEEAQKQVAELASTTQISNGAMDTAIVEENASLTTKISGLETRLSNTELEKKGLQDRVKGVNEENLKLQDRCKKAEEEAKHYSEENVEKQMELETLKKESEDLLVLLADQDAKIEKLKYKLKELGENVESEDEIDEDEEDEDD